MDQKHASTFYFYSTITLTIIALVLLWSVLQPFVVPLVLAAVGATLLYPVYRWVLAYVRMPAFASLLTVIGSVSCILIVFTLLGYYILVEMQQSYAAFAANPSSVGEVVARLLGTLTFLPTNIVEYAATHTGDYIRYALQYIVGNIGIALSGATDFLLKTLVFAMALYYLLMDGAALKQKVVELIPLPHVDSQFVFSRLSSAAHSVIVGSLFVAFLQGLVSTVGYSLFGLPNAILWGAVTTIAALIPGIGTSLVLIPAIGYLFLVGDVTNALLLMAWGGVAVGLIDNFLSPTLIGARAHLHPLLILLSVLGGLILFGPAGIFLGPLIASVALAFLSLYEHFLRRRLPLD